MTTFYLGTHMIGPAWWLQGVPLFVSRRRFYKGERFQRKLPRAIAPWALDSGGFTELRKTGRWLTSEDAYVVEIERLAAEVGRLTWAAPQDWMCEDFMLRRTGLTVAEHQRRTVVSFLSLRQKVGRLVVPVLQGYEADEYEACIDLYEAAGVDLAAEPVVGVGSVCKRSRTTEAVRLIRRLSRYGFALHGFGLKGATLRALMEDNHLASADSLAWSLRGRNIRPCPEGGRVSCANCLHHALAWRLRTLGLTPLEVAA